MTVSTNVDLEEIRRRIPLSSRVGKRLKLRKSSGGFIALCPFHHEKTPSFHVSDDLGTYKCYGCSAHGSVFDWEMFAEGVTFGEAARRLAEAASVSAAPLPAPTAGTARERTGSDVVDSLVVAAWMWRTASRASGTIVERYLASRGLKPEGAPAAIGALRFHPRGAVVPWRVGQPDGAAPICAPTMLGLVTDIEGAPLGVHATYLARDGSAKAVLPTTRDGRARQSRKMWGKIAGGAVWLGGRPTSTHIPLVVGEGIETAWSFAQRHGVPCRIAAALSLDNLQGGMIRTPQGAIPLWNIRSDPDRPGFVFDDPGEVLIAVDADMKPLLEQKVQRARGARWETGTISRMERAKHCATLATQMWRRAGATRVEAVRPPVGLDFNDMVKGETA